MDYEDVSFCWTLKNQTNQIFRQKINVIFSFFLQQSITFLLKLTELTEIYED